MFALPGTLLLLVFIYVRPLEFMLWLRPVPLLYIFCGLAIFGFAVDLRLRRVRPDITPQVPWVVAFYVWCIITLMVKARDRLIADAIWLAISLVLYAVIAHGVKTFRAFELVAGTTMMLVLFLAGVGVHQGLQPFGCIAITETKGDRAGIYDGRDCSVVADCYEGDSEPDSDYLCEQIGIFGSTSIGGGRVRYLGPLRDPNELALAVSIGVPFAFAFFERRRSAGRLLLLLSMLGLSATCTVFTQSRGGQLVFLVAVGAYFVKRYGWRGIIAGAILAAPLLALGGRSGEEADASSLQRLDCWSEGMTMFKLSPIFGVGFNQFLEYHYLTAHNSYVLTPAELGLPGMYLWSVILYLSTKIPILGIRRFEGRPGAEAAAAWAMALTATMCGLLFGIFFLSFSYHQILWIWVGLSGAFYSSAKTHDPEWKVGFGPRDALLVLVLDVGMIIFLNIYVKVKQG